MNVTSKSDFLEQMRGMPSHVTVVFAQEIKVTPSEERHVVTQLHALGWHAVLAPSIAGAGGDDFETV